jgi:hypothetical protein
VKTKYQNLPPSPSPNRKKFDHSKTFLAVFATPGLAYECAIMNYFSLNGSHLVRPGDAIPMVLGTPRGPGQRLVYNSCAYFHQGNIGRTGVMAFVPFVIFCGMEIQGINMNTGRELYPSLDISSLEDASADWNLRNWVVVLEIVEVTRHPVKLCVPSAW